MTVYIKSLNGFPVFDMGMSALFGFRQNGTNVVLYEDLDEFSHNCYRTTGKPCSCPMCSPGKLGEKKKYKVKHKKLNLEE